MTKYQEYFWQQYDGIVRAVDLPMDYKVYDKRIFCVNTKCFLRDKCIFFTRFKGQFDAKMMHDGVIEDQKGKKKRNVWDKHYPKPNYFNASFGFYVEQSGVTCQHFHEI